MGQRTAVRNLSPCWTVLSSGIPLVRRHWRGKAIQVLHDDVAPPLPEPMPGSSRWELAEHHTLGQANVLHARNVTQPAKTMLTDDVADVTINLEGLCQRCRGDTVIPLLPFGDANDDPHALDGRRSDDASLVPSESMFLLHKAK